jgi:hypothetical protein
MKQQVPPAVVAIVIAVVVLVCAFLIWRATGTQESGPPTFSQKEFTARDVEKLMQTPPPRGTSSDVPIPPGAGGPGGPPMTPGR